MRRTSLAIAFVTLAAGLTGVSTSSTAAPRSTGHAGAGQTSDRVATDTARDIARHSLRGPVTGKQFYFVMGDRFANGDTTNDTGGLGDDRLVSGFDPTSKGFYNGGDLEGLQSKLDYIQSLGTDAIWLTPIFKNKAVQLEDGPSAGYHGYWITDFTQVDPHLGTNADLSALVEAAHARGMKVFFDIITNHTADVIKYEEGARPAYVSKDASPYRTAGGTAFDDRDYAGTGTFPPLDPDVSFPYHPEVDPDDEILKVPTWLNDVTLYHNRGNTTFTGEDSQYGDFFGLDDLFTEHPRVVDGMIDIYRTWVGEFGIDGFRIDTMKHVDDAFWQRFGPGLLRYARSHGKPNFFMFGEVALDGSGAEQKAFTSHYTTHDKMQAILDFPFQDAARRFASKGEGNRQLGRFFRNDDWYTDADSNAYELPTFLGNHDMGRFGFFLKQDNASADDAELLARDRLGHELMYLSRGNPVVYYGDEQGFTGTGGDQLARQTMFASQVPEYQDDDLIGTDSTPAVDNFNTDHPMFAALRRLDRLTSKHPALRSGAQQMRYASSGPGIVAFSRIDRRQQREYVVALNNSQTQQSALVPTYVKKGDFRRVYGEGADARRTNRDRELRVTVPALSAVVYKSTRDIPRSSAAPDVWVKRPHPSKVARGRMKVTANVSGSSFYEVTFQAKIANRRWKTIGTDDSAPYRVFHDVSNLDPATPLRYRAVVLDNAGHTRLSNTKLTGAPDAAITISTPSDGGTIARVYPVTVLASVDPERPTQRVLFERRVGNGAWERLGVDRSSPAYMVTDDVSDVPLGTRVRYRATLLEPGEVSVRSDVVSVRTAAPKPSVDSVTVAGDLQSELGCPGDWQPECAATHLAFDTSDGLWHGTFTVPAGDWHWKVALNDSWNQSYGAGGGGSDISLSVPEEADYRFTWNPITHVPSAEKVGSGG